MRSVLFGRPLQAIAFGLGLLVTGQEPAPALKWEPVVISSGVLSGTDLFPAQVLAMAPRRTGRPPARYIGDANGLLGVIVTAAKPGVSVRVGVRLDGFAEESTLTATLSEAQQTYEVWPTVRFNARALASLRQSVPATAVFSLVVDGVAQPEKVSALTIRAVNDVPVRFRQKDGRELDTSALFAGFVNENSIVVDEITKRAIDVKAALDFKGYQGTPQSVLREVFAVWNILQRDGVKYSSITQSSAPSQTVFSQHVRFPDETYRNKQANCVDGTVLFASVLYKLGIFPELVLTPGHMFLGFFLDPRRSQVMFLETTRIGAEPLDSIRRNWDFKTESGYLNSESYQQFLKAVDVGNRQYQQARAMFLTKAPGYQIIDIDIARRSGILSIPRFDK